jgi:sugar lactone lactonase YvrE
MRFLGHQTSSSACSRPSALQLALLFLLIAGCIAPALGQQAPYILPYTMSTFAGPNPAYTIGAKCVNTTTGITSPTLIALDPQGDGCLASQLSIGTDPHDIRVDAQGNIYWIDIISSSSTLIHKINAQSLQETTYVSSTINSKNCLATVDKYGDGCPANDGGANNTTVVELNSQDNYTTAGLKNQRGLAVSNNGMLYSAGYNDYNIHQVSPPALYNFPLDGAYSVTGIFSIVVGQPGATAATATVTSQPLATAGIGSSRGVGVDAAGNVYVADTGNNIVQEVTGGNLIPLTAANSAGTKPTPPITGSGVASATQVDAPEDVQIDNNGNIIIADAGNNVVRAIYEGGTPFFGITNLVVGTMYVIAGNGAALTAVQSGSTGTYGNTSYAYASNGSAPPVSPGSVNLSVRKLSIDQYNNVYVADSSNEVVWFIDNATGYIRLLAGSFGGAHPAVTTPVITAMPSTPISCSAQTNTLGDGCPAYQASLNALSDMGTSVDNQGNLYITDSEMTSAGAASASLSRLRKVLSGLDFPAVTVGGTSVTQNIFLHFGVTDKQATTNPFTVTGKDYTLGTPSCTLNADSTTDCLIAITFKPSVPGYDTATLTIASAAGLSNSYLLTGTGTAPSIAIDPGNVALFNSTINNAQGVVTDASGNIYIADTGNNRILKYTATTATTAVFAGNGSAGYGGDKSVATSATLKAPRAVATDTGGNVYIADTGNNVIRKVNAAGIITTYAGTGTASYTGDNGPGTSATFSAPSGITADALGQIYVADTGNNRIRQISVNGYVTTLAGGASTICTANTDAQGDGCSAIQTIFSAPSGLAYDSTGNSIYVADTGHNNIRRIGLSNAIALSGTSTTVTFNPVTLIAGTGTAGASLSSSGLATASELNGPTGVSIDAADNVYIADTGNAAIRLVNSAMGTISTIVGINTSAGTGTVPGSGIAAQLTTPASVTVSPVGLLYIADSGNNRILSDSRSQVSYNFGRINVPGSSPVQNFVELSMGNATATLPASLTVTGDTTQFTLTAPSGSTGCTASQALTAGSTCIEQGQFNPTAIGSYSATYADAGSSYSGVDPSITLVGVGAVLTPTSSAVVQTFPATGNAQYGGQLTLTVTVTPTACNTQGAPTCFPTGTVQIVVNNTAGAPLTLSATGTASEALSNLAVGSLTISCIYKGDTYYAASNCPNATITITQASTTSVLTATPNNQPQFTTVTLTATVTSNTSGIPTGFVNFYADGSTTPINPSPVSLSGGVATLALAATFDAYGNVTSAGNTLTPGSHTLTCAYTGTTPSNYATSNCASVTLVVDPQPASIALQSKGCSATVLTVDNTIAIGPTVNCPSALAPINGVTAVAVADGSTTDATIFVTPTNTVSGTLTFSCSGLPAATTCTFSPVSLTVSPTTAAAASNYFDVTFWTDLQSGATASLHKPSIGSTRKIGSGISYALALGWPLTLLGFAGLFRFRRKPGAARRLSLLATLLIMAGSSLLFTGCAGPGAYSAVLTPAGTYPITITVAGGGVTSSTVVDFVVTSPGIPGQE